MRILLTGANGYVGKRLLHVLIEQGHYVICSVRDKSRFHQDPLFKNKTEAVEVDFLDKDTIDRVPSNIDAAYFLIHSMSNTTGNFNEQEAIAAENFKVCMDATSVKQVIYLSGIVNDTHLSRHLASRKNVEDILLSGKYPLTVLRAGIIIGSGSSSFEIIRDLVEKLPVMITPKWVLTKCQPIAIRDVISYLSGVLFLETTYHNNFDIGGPDILTYKEMLLQYAEARGLKRRIFTVPIMSPRLSSYWLYFVTSTSYTLAVNLVNSMKVEVICRKNELAAQLNINPLSYKEAIRRAFQLVEQNAVVSSWKDSFSSGRFKQNLLHFMEVPIRGCFTDHKSIKISDPTKVIENIWSLGGNKGWYSVTFLWSIRGFMDKLIGGVGLRRGRTNQNTLYAGDALDFWRVLVADKEAKRLLLFAEMKLPGEAWLEFKIDDHQILHQTATFRPKGLYGRLYWYAMLPFHFFIFKRMIKNISR